VRAYFGRVEHMKTSGTGVDRTWVDVSLRRGRRSPLVSRPNGRPSARVDAGGFID
jgi:hypothetical protein